ncbi:SIMPL domain-containing protein [Thalassobius sp. S69A]|uniref:SIMPL domain-containing protein n=1 Tax=unclassified Thalassovita TaxID=2619711 RepID=UPI000C0EC08C|nr:hypothetical protein [Paracoccaceae bacterium]MBT25472.1 hypothetical protein [Paracoccaceae bacterium]
MKRIALMIALMGAALPAMADEIQRQITVTGEGTVQMAPDMAVISLGVTHQDKDAARAMARASGAAADVLERLSTMGIAARDVQTSSVTLSPIYTRRKDAGPMEIEGFRAGLSMSVRVRDLPKLGAVLGAVVQDGANQFSGLQFALSQPQEAQDAARKDAVADALRKAGLYAQAAGASLGDVLQISENGGYSAPKMRMAADMAESVPIAEGELNISQSVTLVIELK